MSANARQFYHNNPDSPPRSPLSPCHPSPYNPAIRFANNRLSTYSDVSIHDLSDFCEDELDDYLQDPSFQTHLSTDNLIDKNGTGHLDKLYGGILGSQQWSFGASNKPQSVDYDLGNWSKTSTMMLSEPPKKKYLLETKVEQAEMLDEKPDKGVDEAKEHAKAEVQQQQQVDETKAEDMSKAPAQAISFAQPDFFSRQEKSMMRAFRGEEEQDAPFYKKHRLVIIVMCALFMVLAIVLIALGATGHFNREKVIGTTPSEGGHSMSMMSGDGSTWQTQPVGDPTMGSKIDAGQNGHIGGAWVQDPNADPWTLDTLGPSMDGGVQQPVKPSIPQEPVAPIDPTAFTVAASSFALSGEGEGTYYSPSVGVGACGTTHSDAEFVAALNIPQFGSFINPANSPACGACITISGPKGSVNVKVVDKCPGCKQGDIDLSPAAFGSIADMAAGRIKITWAPC